MSRRAADVRFRFHVAGLGFDKQPHKMSTELENPRFPVGLRVIVVDDDPLCLRIVEKMLKRCQYEGAAISCFFFAAGDATPSRERIECDVRARKTRGAGPSIVARGFGDSWCMETRVFKRQTRLRLTRVVGPASYPANEPPRPGRPGRGSRHAVL